MDPWRALNFILVYILIVIMLISVMFILVVSCPRDWKGGI